MQHIPSDTLSATNAGRTSKEVMKSCLWVREAGCGYAEVVEGV